MQCGQPPIGKGNLKYVMEHEGTNEEEVLTFLFEDDFYRTYLDGDAEENRKFVSNLMSCYVGSELIIGSPKDGYRIAPKGEKIICAVC